MPPTASLFHARCSRFDRLAILANRLSKRILRGAFRLSSVVKQLTELRSARGVWVRAWAARRLPMSEAMAERDEVQRSRCDYFFGMRKRWDSDRGTVGVWPRWGRPRLAMSSRWRATCSGWRGTKPRCRRYVGDRVLTVRSSATAVTGNGIVESTTKTKRDRHVPVPEPVWNKLTAELPADPNAPVFPSRKGGFLPPGEYRWAFDNACADVGIEGLVPHGLRYTTASLAITAGANVKVVQRLRGGMRRRP